jgi:hypothetical protein
MRLVLGEFETLTIFEGDGDFNCSTNCSGYQITKIITDTLYINLKVSKILL